MSAKCAVVIYLADPTEQTNTPQWWYRARGHVQLENTRSRLPVKAPEWPEETRKTRTGTHTQLCLFLASETKSLAAEGVLWGWGDPTRTDR